MSRSQCAVVSSQRRHIGVSDQRCSDRRNDAVRGSDAYLKTASLLGTQDEGRAKSVEFGRSLRHEGGDVLDSRLIPGEVQEVS